MAVHILTFLSMVSSVPSLHASFTEDDFKMVFGVALQYLQHYNQLRNSPTRSWALSQHVRQQSYVTVYSWFTVLRLPDRPAHIPYVTRQLLLANEGREVLDGATEVCFDWLARNTYGCANSEKTVAHNIILQPNIAKPATVGPSKTWLYGNSFLTVKALDRKGWEDLIRIGADRIPPDLQACLLEDLLEAPALEASHNIELSGDQNSQSAGSQRREEEQSTFASHLFFHLSPLSETAPDSKEVSEVQTLAKSLGLLDRLPVIDTHKVGIMYAGPGQTNELDILRNSHGSQAYTRFLDGIGKLVHLRSEKDFYTGSLDPDEDGEYAYAWGDDIKQSSFTPRL
ncbi:hypothetical protein BKA70DRAFT_1422604 [Coprinopsis sp. MPI-PUGE-AT-0042]|nr:hypothetical protein BKA70DRAFT_1422604 [Coprinopsis sp. MPI-PUGE-AT-0042]